MKALVPMGILAAAALSFAQSNPVGDVLTLQEDASPIWRNPGKGWVFYAGDPSWLTADQQSRLSICYVRYNWSAIHTAENTFNWSVIDKDLNSCKAAGLKFAFGVANLNMNWGPDDGYATPKWVFDAGARSYRVKDERRPTLYNVIPYWTDNPIFLAKQNIFIKALGARYNGNPNVAWVDIRNYGNWGEGHQGGIDKDENGKSIPYPTSSEMTRNYHQPYIDAFPNTQLTLCYGLSSHDSAYKVAADRGVGMRVDGIPDWSDGTSIAFTNGKQPNIIEYTSGYEDLVSQKIWTDAKVIQCALNAHASYAEVSRGNPQQFMTAADAYMKSLTNKMGYHFVLDKMLASWTKIGIKSPFAVTMQWKNKGTTNLYNENCFIALALLDKTNKLIDTSWLAGVDPKTWKPGDISFNANVLFAKAPVGTYKLAVGLFTSKAKTSPDYKIGNTGRLSTGWTVLTESFTINSTVSIAAKPEKPTPQGSTGYDLIGRQQDRSTQILSTPLYTSPKP